MANLRVFCIIASLTVVLTEECDSGWFGPACRYKSHCANSNCDQIGSCPRDDRCDWGWFGPACQYVNLVANIKSVASYPDSNLQMLMDRTDMTCLPEPVPQNLTITLGKTFPVSWIRLYLIPSGANPFLSIRATQPSNTTHVLPVRTIWVSDRIFDIHLNKTVDATTITISNNVHRLCSMYISGGRNVALRQSTDQSSTLSYKGGDLVSSLAVDGNTNGYLRKGQISCSSTKFQNLNADWHVKFSSPKQVDEMVIHSRGVVELQSRLQDFVVIIVDTNGHEINQYVDKDPIPRQVYSFLSTSRLQAVSTIHIQTALKSYNNSNLTSILSLCEVEIFGDSVCVPGTYGLECEHACNCMANGVCEVSTGLCSPGCKAKNCTTNCYPDPSPSSDGLVLYIGAAAAAAVFIIIVVIIFVCCYRRRKKAKTPQEYDVPGTSREEVNDYNVFFRPDNQETKRFSIDTSPTAHLSVSGVYERIDSTEYAELTEYTNAKVI